MINVTVLGTGTSTGVPSVACDCSTCRSDDPRDKRLRTSLLLSSPTTTVVIDTSSDFRQQMLTYDVLDLDAVIYTHHHFDHIGGFDDIRPYNFRSGKAMPIYAMAETINVLESTFPYAFGLVESTGAAIPSVDVHVIDAESFTVGDIPFTPIPLRHGKAMRVNGYRIGNFAYCTDTNFISEGSLDLLMGLDVLILDGLRWEPHPTHYTIDEAIGIVDRLRPRITYLTHVAHQVRHAEADSYLPSHIRMAWDGLQIQVM